MSLDVPPSVGAPVASRPYSRLSAVLFGANPKHRGTVMVSMYASAVYVACMGLVAYFVKTGFTDPAVGFWMMGGLAATIILNYAMLRSGWSTRFKDPALTVFQIILAISWDCVTYALIGPAHAGMLMLMALSLFFGIFSLDASSARITLAYTLVAAGSTMVLQSVTDPATFAPDLQFVYFAALVLVTSMNARLATSLTGMRRELEAQRQGLSTALERIREASSRDALTGLHNRRYMLEMLAHEVQRHQRFKTGFSLALVDLDHFKQFNDQYGHQTGDAALCCFARQAQATLRSGDLMARWGGEEFLFLYPESCPEDAQENLELLRKTLIDTSVSTQHPALRVRFSAGLTAFVSDEPIQKTIERTDQALYQAKAAGRNRCETRLEAAV